MTLAQVVYHMSTDRDFADQLLTDPASALDSRGWKLSTEELNFLLTVNRRGDQTKTRVVELADDKAGFWRSSRLAEPAVVSMADQSAGQWRASKLGEPGIVAMADESAGQWRASKLGEPGIVAMADQSAGQWRA